jgi:competence protein ComFC
MSVLEKIISVISPFDCLGCSREGQLLCGDCTLLLPPVMPRCYVCHAFNADFSTCQKCRRRSPLAQVIVVTEYDTEQVKKLLCGLKFGRQASVAAIIAGTMQNYVVSLYDVISHVPTANVRVRVRGYDQAQLIARDLAKKSGVQHSALLGRIGSQRQLGRTRDERLQQLRGAFVVRNLDCIEGKNILLVDDVITTGATLESAARELKAAGAKSVSAIVFATA